MKLVARWEAYGLGAFSIVDLDLDEFRIGRTSWTRKGGYVTYDRDDNVVINGAGSLDQAITLHADAVADFEESRRIDLRVANDRECEVCGKVKLLRDFAQNHSGMVGRRSTCRQCELEMEWIPWRERRELVEQKRLGGI